MVEFSVNWWWVLGCLLASAGISYWFYRKDKSMLSIGKNLLFFFIVIRFFSLFTILFLLLNPIITTYKALKQEPLLLFLADNSASIALASKDSASLKREIQQFGAQLRDVHKTDFLLFDKSLNTDNQLNFRGKSTNFQSAMTEVENEYLHSNVVGIVLLSDGITTEGASPKDIGFLNVPVYTLSVGDSSVRRDLIVKEVYHNKITYLKNEFPIEVKGLAKNAIGATVKIKVYYDGKLVTEKSFKISRLQEDFSFMSKIRAVELGTHKITAHIEGIAGEITLLNNTITSYIDVLDERQKLLVLYQNPHPDIAAFKNSFLGNENYTLSTESFKESKSDLSKYNLIVVFGMPENKNEFTFWEEKLSNSSANLLMFLTASINFNYFSSTFLSLKSKGNLSNDAFGVFNQNFDLFTFAKQDIQIFNSFPPLVSPYGNISFPFESNTLFFQKIGSVETSNSLISFGEVKRKKVGFVLGEGVWRWKLHEAKINSAGETPVFNHLFQQISKFLFVQEDKDNFILQYKKSCTEDEEILIGAQLYNKSYEKVNSTDLFVQIIGLNKKTLHYKMSKTEDAYALNVGLLYPGEYQIKATTQLNGKKISKSGRFVVTEVKLESVNLQAHFHVLKSLSNRSKGLFYPFERREELITQLKSLSFKNKTFYEKASEGLINLKWICILLVLLLGIEWFLRKWHGTI